MNKPTSVDPGMSELARVSSEETPAADRPHERRRIKQLDAMVLDVVQETSDTATLVLFTGNERLEYAPGHFLTVDPHQFESLARFTAFLEDTKGRREPPRAFSLSSAPHEKYIAFTVKEERYISGTTKYPPLLSPLLVRRTPRGSRLTITGFTGPYTLPPDVESQTDHLVHVCAGSGIVPNFSILKHALREHRHLRHTLLYSNRTWSDVIFGRALTELATQHPDRLRIVHTLTRQATPPDIGVDVRTGRVDVNLLREAIPDPRASLALVCGPGISPWERAAARSLGQVPAPRFLESVLAALEALGVPKDRVLRESYG